MNVFIYDHTFEGLLCAVFEAFRLKLRPDRLLTAGEPLPLLAENLLTVVTDETSAARVWDALQKKVSGLAIKQVAYAWLAEDGPSAELVFHYLGKIFSGVSETDFTDPDVLALRQLALKVDHERERVLQFVRFQKTADNIYFAGVSPFYNVVPLTVRFFADRFADQRWIIYDLDRGYGFHYDLNAVREIDFFRPVNPDTGQLNEAELAEDEAMFQEAWRKYFKAVNIAERANPRLQRQFMPKRFWPYLTEMRPVAAVEGSGGER